MVAVVANPTQLCNYALAKVGYKLRIGSLYDGSEAAKKALDVYGQTRDHLLYEGEWDFAERTQQGTLIKQAPSFPASYVSVPWSPAFPALPWSYEYAYPADALKIRSVKRQPVFIPDFDPHYNRFSIDNDFGVTPPLKVILTDIPNAIIVYTGQITDPNQWDEGFLEEFADALGKTLGPALMNLDAYKVAAANLAQDMPLIAGSRERG